jgi:hypothetical protein
MVRLFNLIIRITVALIILVLSNCWFGAYQSAKLLDDGEHSIEPIIDAISAPELTDYYGRGGLRYTLGGWRSNHQVLLFADLFGITESDYYGMYTLQYGIKKQVRKDKVAFLYEFGIKSDLRVYTNAYFSYSPLFSIPVSAYTTFTIAPSIKLNIVNADQKLAPLPCLGLLFNCETGFAKIKVIPEISAYISFAGFFVCSGIGIPIQFGSKKSGGTER